MAINTGNIAKLLMPGLNQVWGDGYTDHPMEYTDLFDVSSSEKNYEEDQLLPGFGLAPAKTEGAQVTYDSLSQGITTRYTHVAYAKGFIVTREAIADNQYKAKALTGTKRLARSFRQTKENVAANVYNRAFATYTRRRWRGALLGLAPLHRRQPVEHARHRGGPLRGRA
jgi:hypothetical protein